MGYSTSSDGASETRLNDRCEEMEPAGLGERREETTDDARELEENTEGDRDDRDGVAYGWAARRDVDGVDKVDENWKAGRDDTRLKGLSYRRP